VPVYRSIGRHVAPELVLERDEIVEGWTGVTNKLKHELERHFLRSLVRGSVARPNGSRLSCGALVNDSFLNLRAPSDSSAG